MRLSRNIRHYVGWFGLSIIMFGLAAMLTHSVTNVGGRVPVGSPSDEPRSAQIFGVFVRGAGDLASQHLRVSYSEDRTSGERTIGLWFPEKREVKVLLNHISIKDKCELVPNEPFFEPQSFSNVIDESPIRVFTLRVAESVDGFGSIRCKLNYFRENLSFTHRIVQFWFLAEKLDEFPPALAELLSGFAHYPRATVNFAGVEGAERFSFNSDAPQAGGELPEGRQFNAALQQDTQLPVQWIDFYSEQLRDLLLIVIGTLIAIGATTLIEGLRPLIS